MNQAAQLNTTTTTPVQDPDELDRELGEWMHAGARFFWRVLGLTSHSYVPVQSQHVNLPQKAARCGGKRLMEDPSAKGLAVKPWEDKFEDSPSTARHGWLIWGKGGKSISTTKSGFGKRTIQLGNEEGHVLGGASIRIFGFPLVASREGSVQTLIGMGYIKGSHPQLGARGAAVRQRGSVTTHRRITNTRVDNLNNVGIFCFISLQHVFAAFVYVHKNNLAIWIPHGAKYVF